MPGSTIIAEKDESRLAAIASVEDLDGFIHVDLDAMTTVDLASFATAAKVRWAEGEPVKFDQEGGLAIFKISEAGIGYLISHISDVPEEYRDDARRLAAFVEKNGKSHIYELATF